LRAINSESVDGLYASDNRQSGHSGRYAKTLAMMVNPSRARGSHRCTLDSAGRLP
jgi:hypothetical protein